MVAKMQDITLIPTMVTPALTFFDIFLTLTPSSPPRPSWPLIPSCVLRLPYRFRMPTVSLATNAAPGDEACRALINECTDVLYTIVGCPREFVHIDLSTGKVGTWGGDFDAPWVQMRIVLGEGQVDDMTKRASIGDALKPIVEKHTGTPAGRFQVLFEDVRLDHLYIGHIGVLGASAPPS